jgi:hypothetical protein
MPLQSANIPKILTLEQWTGSQGVGGVNQSASRSTIDDNETWWCENFFPIAPGELRSAWGPSDPIYNAPAGTQIKRIFFTNIDGVNALGFMFLDDGEVHQVNLETGAVTGLGYIWAPEPPYYWADLKLWSPNQFGNVAGQPGGVVIGSPAGLFAWDGYNLYAPGGPAPNWLTLDNVTGNTTTMPYGLPGIYAMEVYLQRLFVMGQTVISMSGPSNGANFSVAGGGGSWGYTGDQLTVSYTDMAQSSNFLFVFGDSMTNYVSGLQLVGSQSPIGSLYTTQFNYANLNPQIGHRYFRPVGHWLQNMIVFDGAGIFSIGGTNAVWISQKITNLIATVVSGGFIPTITTAHIFGQRWLLINGQFTDSYGVSRSMMLCWNGQIWTVASQHLNLTHIGSYVQDSTLTPYGTDGTSLYKLFARPDPTLLKSIRTKAYAGPNQLTVKDWKRVYMKLRDKLEPPGPEGVYMHGMLSAGEGGVAGGAHDISFEIPPGSFDTIGHGASGKGLVAWVDVESTSPDFVVERIVLTYDETTLFGA